MSVANQDGKFESGHLLYWTEDSRIHTIADQQYYSYYTYGHGGERTLKLVGQNSVLDVNANTTNNARMLDDATLYPPPISSLHRKAIPSTTIWALIVFVSASDAAASAWEPL